MEKTNSYRWVAGLFFIAVTLFFTWSIYYLAVGQVDPAYYWPASQRRGVHPDRTRQTEQRFLLLKDEATHLEDLIVTYRGIDDGKLILDVIIPQLDPHVSYLHRIPESVAKKGFLLSNLRFRLISARNSKIRFEKALP